MIANVVFTITFAIMLCICAFSFVKTAYADTSAQAQATEEHNRNPRITQLIDSAVSSLGKWAPDIGKNYGLNILEDGTQRSSNRGTSAPESVTLQSTCEVTTLCSSPIVHLNRHDNPEAIVLYIHGGSYRNDASASSWSFLDRLCAQTNAYVVMPCYPLAPKYAYDNGYLLIDTVYERLANAYGANRIVLMGDSAGGGLAAGFAERLVKQHRAGPRNLVLISPWLDITMSNPDIEPYEETDTMLDVDRLISAGKDWARELNADNYLVSPINGDVRGLPPTTMFTGTMEVFTPDIELFAEKLREAGVECDLYVHEGMQHVYALRNDEYSDEAFATVVDVVSNNAHPK